MPTQKTAGFDDIAIGASRDTVGDTYGQDGAVSIFYGPQFGHHSASEAAAAIRGIKNKAKQVGMGLAAGGDVNADGYDDLFVGAPVGNGFPGSAYLFLGGPRTR